MSTYINRKNALLATAILIAILIIALGRSTITYYFSSATNAPTTLYIPTEGIYQGVIDSLERSNVLVKPKRFKRFADNKNLENKLRAGRYEIKKGDTYADIIRKIERGMQSPVKVTFNNARTIDRLAALVAPSLEADSATFLRTFTNDSIAKSYGFTPSSMIAMFIPNTYEFYWNTSPEKFVQKMNKEYEKFWNSERKQKLKELGMSRTEATTLASIVYEETKKSDEMPRVAGVYVNRLKRKIPLQADPTVKFALGDFSIKRVLHKHLTYDSPYNTYVYAGLPPSPICMPSIKAIDAVLGYEKHNYVYFCARPDFSGYHNFAETLDLHNKNARAYARALNKLNIYK